MPGPRRDHRLILYGPDRKYGARPKKGFKHYIWYILWYEGSHKREHSTGEEDFGAAEKYLQEIWLPSRTERPDGPSEPYMIDVATVLSLYGEEHAPHTANPARVGYAIDALLPYWKGKTCDQILKKTCQEYTRHRMGQRRAESTARRELGTLRAALNFCRMNGYLTMAPEVALPEKAEAKNRWLTRKEAAALLWAAKTEPKARFRIPLFILIALYTGARTRAILTLQWQENPSGGWIDLENNLIHWQPAGFRQTNKRRPRPTPIPERLLRFLKYQRRRTRTWVFEINGKWAGDNKTAFNAATRNAWLTKDTNGKPIKGALKDVTRHTLKHTSITWMMQKGVPGWKIAGYTGTSIETIQKVYAHHAPNHMKEVMEAFR